MTNQTQADMVAQIDKLVDGKSQEELAQLLLAVATAISIPETNPWVSAFNRPAKEVAEDAIVIEVNDTMRDVEHARDLFLKDRTYRNVIRYSLRLGEYGSAVSALNGYYKPGERPDIEEQFPEHEGRYARYVTEIMDAGDTVKIC